MVFFCAAPANAETTIAVEGLPYDPGTMYRLWTRLEAVPAGEDQLTLVVHSTALPSFDPNPPLVDCIEVETVSREHILNVHPYRKPIPVAAAGGIVTRKTQRGCEVLAILRRGVWDFPKGKVDDGEEIDAGAIREVMEETGADNVQIVAPLGTTIHAYPLRDRHAVKTTWWFEMKTSTEAFVPETKESIEEVRWFPLDHLARQLGYATLSELVERVAPRLCVGKPD